MSLEQTQLAIIGRAKLTARRAREYADRLAAHAATLRAAIDASRSAAVLGEAPADVEGARAELAEVERQHGLAVAALTEAESEYSRHRSDLDAMLGADGRARAALAAAQQTRTTAAERVARAADILDRGNAHVADLERKLSEAQSAEASLDQNAAERVRQALQDGAAVASGRASKRISADIADDLRAARLTVSQLERDHADARADLSAADRDVASAVDGVLMVDAEHVARELEATEIRAAMLRRRLTTYTERQPIGYVAPVVEQQPAQQTAGGWLVRNPSPSVPLPVLPKSPLVAKIMTGPAQRMLGAGPAADRHGPSLANWRQEADAWTVYADALATDAQAEPRFATAPAYVPGTLPPVVTMPAPAMPDLARHALAARDARSAA